MIPRADNLTPFPFWTEVVRDQIGGDGSVPIWQGEEWRVWVDRFREASDGDVLDIPRQIEFRTFEAWADEFIRLNE